MAEWLYKYGAGGTSGQVLRYSPLSAYVAVQDPSLVIVSTKVNVAASSVNYDASIKVTYDNRWDASSRVSWITLTKTGQNSYQDGVLQLGIATNSSTNIRLGTVDVSTRFGQIGTIDVSQAGAVADYLYTGVSILGFADNGTPCTNGYFNLFASGSWTLTDNMTWCTPDATMGTGNLSINLTVTSNVRTARSGVITITQGALNASVGIEQCAYTVLCCV